nr:hypothetical protein [Tanacetum cinerariifolium]
MGNGRRLFPMTGLLFLQFLALDDKLGYPLMIISKDEYLTHLIPRGLVLLPVVVVDREAWGLSMDASDNAHSDVISLRTTLVAQHAFILDLQAADRRRQRVIKELLAADHKRQGITTALATRDVNRNGDDSHTSGTGRPVQVARECTYPDFLKCQPLNFKGTEGVIGLSSCNKYSNMKADDLIIILTWKAPLSPDYVLGPEEPEQAPPSPVYLPYVSEPVYLEYMPPEDNVFPAEEQPLPVAATPTADSLGYIPEFDPKGDLEEDDEEDPADYPADSTFVALPAVDHVPSEEVTMPLPQIPSPPLHIPSPPPDSPTHIEIPESCLPLRKRLRFASPTPSQEVGESLAAGAARKDEPAETTIMYGMMEDAQDDREDRMAREAWGLSMDASDNAHSDVISLRTTLVAQHALILDLQASNHRRQGVIIELLAADHKRQGVTSALAAHDANRNGDDSHTSGMGRPVQVARECTYPNFLKCQPLNFKGTEGVVGLSQWFEKMESVYSISNSTVACQVKFTTCTLQGNALTWWNSHVKTTTPEAAHAMPRRTLKKMMTDKYCPMRKIKKLEFEISTLGLNVRLITKENLMTPPGTTINNQTRDKTLEELMLQGMVTGEHTKGLDLFVPNVTITTTVLVLPNATSATDLVIYLVTAEIPQMSTLGLIRGATFVLNVVLRGISRRNVQKLKNNNNRGNQVGNAKAQAKVYAVGKARANPDKNVVAGSLKKYKKRIPEDLKPREQDTRRTSGNTTRIDPFPPSLILEAQTQALNVLLLLLQSYNVHMIINKLLLMFHNSIHAHFPF